MRSFDVNDAPMRLIKREETGSLFADVDWRHHGQRPVGVQHDGNLSTVLCWFGCAVPVAVEVAGSNDRDRSMECPQELLEAVQGAEVPDVMTGLSPVGR